MATTVTTRSSAAASSPSPVAPALTLNTNPRMPTTTTTTPTPHKHLPFCSPGPRPSPPSSPPQSAAVALTSLTYPPDAYPRLRHDPPVYAISAAELEQAVEHLATQPLPCARSVFPWLHGLHADNQLQLAFFIARRKSLRRTPRGLRAITIVKARGDLSHSKLRGAIAPDELLRSSSPRTRMADGDADFIDIDPRDGFSVRNFQIQACKMATVSDIVVYGDMTTPRSEVEALAARLARAQSVWQQRLDPKALGERLFNTFVLSDDYEFVETDHPELVAYDADGCMTGKVMDFFHWERMEMYCMSTPSEISHNVWLGPTPSPELHGLPGAEEMPEHPDFDIGIEASDLAQVPDGKVFQMLDDLLDSADGSVPQLEFPGSGAILPPTWSQTEVDGLMDTCVWMYRQAHGCVRSVSAEAYRRRDSKLSTTPPKTDVDGDSVMRDVSDPSPENGNYVGRRILIHCNDGYTESSLLALAYYMYAEGVAVHDAWLALHREQRRNFFAYASDVALLRAIQPRILQASPALQKRNGDDPGLTRRLCPPAPDWLDRMDGSLPSRILDYMYLGNLGHANNPGLLRELGIGQVLSVGEPVTWARSADAESFGPDDLLYVDKVQDNGVDPLTDDFGRCLDFIERGRQRGTATLVHCRVGVSRSATICIAEVMRARALSFPRAYCFVRARRLNVIIQPHLRFAWELLQWEEALCLRRGAPLRRELEWAAVAREIAAMNRPYARQK